MCLESPVHNLRHKSHILTPACHLHLQIHQLDKCLNLWFLSFDNLILYGLGFEYFANLWKLYDIIQLTWCFHSFYFTSKSKFFIIQGFKFTSGNLNQTYWRHFLEWLPESNHSYVIFVVQILRINFFCNWNYELI